MIRRISFFIVVVFAFLPVTCMSVESLADDSDGIDYVEYVLNNNISSRDEFLRLIGVEDRVIPDGVEVSFTISVDEDSDLIVTDTVYESEDVWNRGTKSGSASHDVYNSAGSLLYTINVSGTFNYISGVHSTCVSVNGSFQSGANSSWSSTPTKTRGHINVTKAYARISGTASCTGYSNKYYELNLYCTDKGKLSSDFSGS